MTLSPGSCHFMMHKLIAEQQEQSWLRQLSCTWRGAKVWTTAVLGGFLMEVSAIPSRSLEIGVEDLTQVSELCTVLGTKLASLIQTAIMMRIVSRVSMMYVLGVIMATHIINIYFNPLLSTDNGNTHIDSMGDTTPDHEISGQDVVILTETDQELQLNQHAEVELKAQQVVESFPFYLSSSEEYLVDFQPTLSDTTESLPSSSPGREQLQQLHATAYPTEISFDPQHPTVLEKGAADATEVYDSPQNTSLQPSVYNKTDSHHIFNLMFQEADTESTTKFVESTYESETQEPTAADRNLKNETETPQRTNVSQEIEMTNINVSRTQHHNKKKEGDQEESLWKGQMKLEEATVNVPLQMFLSTQASKEDDELITQTAEMMKSSIKNQSSIWAPLDGSGDASKGTLHVK